jgi:hypothetical protein
MLRRMRWWFWLWVPHTCRFRWVERRTPRRKVEHGAVCVRCGTAVWFYVEG